MVANYTAYFLEDKFDDVRIINAKIFLDKPITFQFSTI